MPSYLPPTSGTERHRWHRAVSRRGCFLSHRSIEHPLERRCTSDYFLYHSILSSVTVAFCVYNPLAQAVPECESCAEAQEQFARGIVPRNCGLRKIYQQTTFQLGSLSPRFSQWGHKKRQHPPLQWLSAKKAWCWRLVAKEDSVAGCHRINGVKSKESSRF
jgi:hypothetical protein